MSRCERTACDSRDLLQRHPAPQPGDDHFPQLRRECLQGRDRHLCIQAFNLALGKPSLRLRAPLLAPDSAPVGTSAVDGCGPHNLEQPRDWIVWLCGLAHELAERV